MAIEEVFIFYLKNLGKAPVEKCNKMYKDLMAEYSSIAKHVTR